MCNIIIKTYIHDICGATLNLSGLQMFKQVSVIFQWIYSFWGILHLSWEPLYFITISWSRINLSFFLFRATLTAWQPAKLLESFTNSLYLSLSFQAMLRTCRTSRDPVRTPSLWVRLRVITWCPGRQGRRALRWIYTRWCWMRVPNRSS